MSGPQTKGILLGTIVADVQRLVEEERISREDLEAELGPVARKLLQDGLSLISWYPSEVYRDLARVLMKLEGKGIRDMAYLRARGERAGKRLLESGLYQQLDYLKRATRTRKNERIDRKAFERNIRLIVSMQAALMKGGTWSLSQDPDHADRVQIVLSDVEGLPEESAQAICGILTGITMHGGSGFSWRYERPAPGRIVYQMDRDISALGHPGSVPEV